MNARLGGVLFALFAALLTHQSTAAPQSRTDYPSRITITSKSGERDIRLPARSTASTEFVVHIDVATSGLTPGVIDEGEPDFVVRVSSGTVTPNTFSVARGAQEGYARARADVPVTYYAAANPAPGEVVITVEGSQGIRLLGQATTGAVYRGEGRLILVPVGRGAAPPAAPPATPPFEPTPHTVNPTGEMIRRAALLALLLGTAAALRFTLTRSRAEASREPESRQKPRREPPLPRFEEQEPDRVIELFLEPTAVNGERVDRQAPVAVNGDGSSTVGLQAVVSTQPGLRYTVVGTPVWTVTHPNCRVTPEASGFEATLRVGWEWPQIVDVEVAVSATFLVRGRPQTRTARANVRIYGADPQLLASADMPIVCANGHDCVHLGCELWLFGAPAKGERLAIDKVSATINGKEWARTKGDCGGISPCSVDWQAPFLLQHPGRRELMKLTVKGRWTGGPLFERAPQPRQTPQPTWCEVEVRGCHARFEACDAAFLPVPGTRLRATGCLVDGDNRDATMEPMPGSTPGPNFDASQARIRCEVRDLSQGKPGLLNGCKIPARSALDVPWQWEDLLAGNALEDILAKIPARTFPLSTTERGVLKTAAGETEIPVCDYRLEPDNEPVSGGPVISTLRIDDGFGGQLALHAVSLAKLGTLVLETGGLDFRIYESDLFAFELQHLPPSDVRAAHGRDRARKVARRTLPNAAGARFRWEFALVDTAGSPVCPAGDVELSLTPRSGAGGKERFYFFVGDTPASHLYFHRPSGTPEKEKTLRHVRRDLLNDAHQAEWAREGWTQIGDVERDTSLQLRRRWHELATSQPQRPEFGVCDEPALPWLTAAAKDNPWQDKTLSLAVRVELRDSEGNLVATSDRWIGEATRTPPERVWTDHTFRYVLAKCRLRLYDGFGQPRAKRRYRLSFGPLPFDGSTESGVVEELVPPGAETALLQLAGETVDTSVCDVLLRLGPLEDVETIAGQQQRLNNLGLFASNGAIGTADERLTRALLRFQELTRLGLTGKAEGRTAQQLAAVHDAYGFANLPDAGSVFEGGRQPIPRGDGPAPQRHHMRVGPTVEDPLHPGPPPVLLPQEAWIALGLPNVLRIPWDPAGCRKDYWFDTTRKGEPRKFGNPPRKVTEGNEVLYFIDAAQAFKSIAEAMREARGPDDFIYVAGWWLSWDLELIPEDRTSTPLYLLKDASERGVEVRALLFNHVLTDEKDPYVLAAKIAPTMAAVLAVTGIGQAATAVGVLGLAAVAAFAVEEHLTVLNMVNIESYVLINKLAHGACIIDRRMLNFGSHHQKIIVVKAGEELTAFCGGLDLNPDRLYPKGATPNHKGETDGAPFHDVHCRIRGPAAAGLLNVFVERWKDHRRTESRNPPLLSNATELVKPLGGDGFPEPFSRPTGRQHVQVGCTYGNAASSTDPRPVAGGYDFARFGERTARQMILHAISRAQRFIYLEDQYLISLEARDAILEVLPRIHHFTAIVPDNDITDLCSHTREARQAFLKPLLLKYPDKVRVFVLRPSGGPHSYVHAKTWVFDDEFAIIGSANCNLRSYTHDTEVVAGILDDSSEDACLYHLAHQLRVALWAEHLNLDTPEGHAELADGVASAALWLRPPPGARIAPFDLNKPDNPAHKSQSWDLVEPDGS